MDKTKCCKELGMRMHMAFRFHPEPPPTIWGRVRNWYNRRAWWWR